MFLDAQFCEDNDVRIEKMHHMPTIVVSDRISDLDDLMHDLDGCQTQFSITDKTKELADFFDAAHEAGMSDYNMKDALYRAGFGKGIVLEVTLYQPSSIGRPILYLYAESELEVKAFIEAAAAKVWESEGDKED